MEGYVKSFDFALEDDLFDGKNAVIHYNFEPGEPASFTSNHDDNGYSDPGSEDWYDYKVMIYDLDVTSVVDKSTVINAICEDMFQEAY